MNDELEQLKNEIKELKKEVTELKARGPEVHNHYHYQIAQPYIPYPYHQPYWYGTWSQNIQAGQSTGSLQGGSTQTWTL